MRSRTPARHMAPRPVLCLDSADVHSTSSRIGRRARTRRSRGPCVSDPRSAYTARVQVHAEARDRAARDADAISRQRTATFFAAFLALVLWDSLKGTPALVALGALALLMAAFGVLVSRHRRARRRERKAEVLHLLAEEGLHRLDRRWSALDEALPDVERDGPDVDPAHPYARDLDVFGAASLTRLAGPVTSGPGRALLREWLLGPADFDVVRARQEAVRELAPALEFRLGLAALGRLAPPSDEHAVAAVTSWAEEDPQLHGRRWALAAAWVLPPLLVWLVALAIWWSAPPFWIVPLVLQLWLLVRLRKQATSGFSVVEEGAASLRAASPQLRLIAEQRWSASLLVELTDGLRTGGVPAHEALARFARIADTVEGRRGLMYQVIAPILLIDVHLGFALDRWRARWGRSLRTWLDTLARMEALSALASLGHDHPDWVMPTLEAPGGNNGPVVRAQAIGHPLLPPSTCIRNDVEAGPPGTFLFITGSNMSGKSTLLRAVGANVVLAGAGAPVCARSFSLPPLRLWTSMRVDDSVVDGVSRFMAELLRVRSIVEAAGTGSEDDAPVLYLVDEMLQGTNTAERRVAARAVLRHLLSAGAIGSVTSHDLTLADAPDLVSRRSAFHFRERVESRDGGTRLTFDYVLRPGIATTRNALRLLEAVGLGRAAEEDMDETLHQDREEDS